MTRIAVHSDLHLELQEEPINWLSELADILVLAGDIMKIDEAGEFLIDLSARYPEMPIIYVVGNHEFYGCESLIQSELELREQLKEFPNIHFLQCDAVTIRGIRFLGCTGWSQMTSRGQVFQEQVMGTVGTRINDFRRIKVEGLKFTAQDCVNLGMQHRSWLEEKLAENAKEPTVVITHFSPAIEFGNARYPVDDMTAYFCSDYIDLIKNYEPELWLFGHTHYNVNEIYDSTRVLSNQHGYGRECGDYDPNFIVEI